MSLLYCEIGPLPEGSLWRSMCTHAVISTLALDKVLSIYKILLQAAQNGDYMLEISEIEL